MPDIASLKSQFPELHSLSDDQIVNVMHSQYYPDRDIGEVAKALGVKMAAPAAPAVAPRGAMGTMKDVGISALKSAIGLPEAVVGLADMATGGRVGKALESVGYEPGRARAILDENLTDAQKAANAEFQNAEGIPGKFAAAIQNPSVIGHAIVESSASMLGGAGAARGLLKVAPKMGAAIGAAAGEGVVGAGQAAEQIRSQTPDRLLTPGQSLAAAASGVGTAVFGALGGKVAQRLGIGDVDTMLAQASLNPAARKGVVRAALEGAVSEGVLEELPQSIQEQVWQNQALGKPLSEGVDEAAVLGLLSGGAMGGVAGPMSSGKAGDPIRDLKTGGTGTLARAADTGLEQQAQQADAGITPSPTVAPTPTTSTQSAPKLSMAQAMGVTGDIGSTEEIYALTDRIMLVKESLADPTTRDFIRQNLGDEAFNEATYYANQADRPGAIPDQTRDNMLSLAEAIVSRARLTPIQQPGALGANVGPAPEALGAPQGVPAIGLDTTPTGTMRVDSQGNAAPEVNADVISTRQAQAERESLGKQGRRASAVPADPAPKAPAPPAAIGYDTTPTGVMRVDAAGNAAPETRADQINTKQAQPVRDDTLGQQARRASAVWAEPAPKPSAAPKALPYDTSPTGRMVAGPDGVTQETNAQRINRQQARSVQPGDRTRPNGQPFKNKPAALTEQRRAGGAVVEVDGGWVVRSQADDATQTQVDAPTEASAPVAAPEPAPAPATQRAPAFLRKTLPEMTEDELSQAGQFYGADHPRASKVKQEVSRRARKAVAEAKRKPKTEPTNEQDAPQAPRTPTQAGGSETGSDSASTGAPGAGETKRVPRAGDGADEAGGVKGEKIDSEWSAFTKESGTLGIPRAEMPQVKAEHRGAMVNFLKGRGIEHEQDEVSASSLKPSQAEFSPPKVEKAKGFTGGDRSILVSQDGHVIDGHHQWLAKLDASEPVKVIRLKAPAAKVIEEVKAFPSAEQAPGAEGVTTGAGKATTGAQGATTEAQKAKAPKAKSHPPTVRGSRALAAISRSLGGLSPDLLPDLSEKVQRTRVSKAGKKTQYTVWDNPAIPGVGPLFRTGGTSDLSEVARVLEEGGYLTAGSVERDPLAATRQAEKIIKAEMREGGSTVQIGDADAVDAEMRSRQEAAMGDESTPWDDFTFPPEDLDAVGFIDADEATQALTEQLIAEAEALGIDTEAIREDTARIVGESASQEEYHAATQEAIRQAIAQAGRNAEERNASTAREGNPDGRSPAEQAGGEGSQGQRDGGSDQEGLSLTAPTRADIEAQQDRAEQADALDEKAQAKRESEVGDSTFMTGFTGDGRQDNTADLFAQGTQEQDQQADTGGIAGATAGGSRSAPGVKQNQAKPDRLTDAGQELMRNRRGKLKGLAWDDVSAMNDTLKVAQVTKTNVWPRPDYAKMVEDGAPAWKAAALKAVYDKLAAAPVTRVTPTDADLKAYIETMNQVRDLLMAELDRVTQAGTTGDAWNSLRSENVFGKVFPLPTDVLPVFGYPNAFSRNSEQGKENNRRALLIGGNPAIQALQFTYKTSSKIKDLLADGFPTKQEAWQKSYEVQGKETRDGDIPEGDRTSEPQQRFFVYEKGSRWRTAKGQQDGGYATQEQAEAFARSLVVKKREALPPSRGLSLEDARRTGPDWRGSKDVTAEQVMAHFGFRGVNLGEYVKAKQNVAQLHLNHIFDAFSDLADLLGVPPKAMSLNGTLGVAIGAQGSGKALAHFVPGVNEINITRDSGAGALAHEFGHALDHYFATQHGRATSMAKRPYLSAVVETMRDPGGVRPEVIEAMRSVMKTINTRPMTEAEAREYIDAQKARNQNLLRRWVKEFKGNKGADATALDAVAAKIAAGDLGEADGVGLEPNLDEFMRAASLKPGAPIAANAFAVAYRLRDLHDEARFMASHIPQVDTEYTKASRAMDAKKPSGEGYWATPWEMFARAFETFTMDALKDKQRESLYLSGLVDSASWGEWAEQSGKAIPYPDGAERLEMQQAFQRLVDTIQTREDDAGSVGMFSRSPEDESFYRSQVDYEWAPPSVVNRVKQQVESLRTFWKNSPEVVVLASFSDAPEAMQRLNDQQMESGAVGEPEGFFYKGKAYILAPHMKSADDVRRVLFHETLGHLGLRGVFGDGLNQILDQLWATRRKDVQAKADSYGLDTSKQNARRMAAEEVLAEMAQDRPEIGFVRRAVAIVKQWLRKNLPGFAGMKMSDDEIVANFLMPAQRFIERGQGAQGQQLVPAFSRVDEPGSGFSRGATQAQAATDLHTQARNAFTDFVGSAGAKVDWLDKSLKTQYAKAQRFPEFGKVFDKLQEYTQGVSSFANQAADQAPDILPKLDSFKDLMREGPASLLRHGLSQEDVRALSAPVFEGTLNWTRDAKGELVETEDPASAGVVFTNSELRDKFGLSDKQIKHYRQFRAAVDESLDQVVAADIIRLLGAKAPASIKALANTIDGRASLREALRQTFANSPDEAMQAIWKDQIAPKYDHVASMKAKGYAPLSRFGKFFVHVVDSKTKETVYFGMEETRFAANQRARDMREEFGAGHEVAQGLMSQESYKLMSDVPVDAMEMFASAIGAEKTEVFQKYIQLAKNNRSTLKRLIKRKGRKGFSMDAPRVLASFVTSNARASAAAVNMLDAKEMAESITDGDVKDEAIKLIGAVSEPQESGAAVRGMMFTNFIGGSIASALVNMTQPVMMTLPYLSQWGGIAKAGKRLVSAAGMTVSGKIDDPDLAKALKQAEDEGIVAPQEIHHLLKQATGTSHFRPEVDAAIQKLAFVWSTPFALAESFNRKASFIAAYQTAKAEGIADPYAFAQKAVTETQGLYNAGNKPNAARGVAGATIMTFKQYSIHYLEWLARMAKNGPEGKKAAVWAIALLVMAAGGDGLPFSDDLNDIIDTIGQALGYDANSKRWRHEVVADAFGPEMAEVLSRGLSASAGFPVDLSVRMGMGNLLPATDLLKKSNTDTAQSLSEIAGPGGALFTQYKDALKLMLSGEAGGAALKLAPNAIQNLGKAAKMMETGEYRDSKDRKVMDVDGADATMKALSFQPAQIARESAKMSENRQSEVLAKTVEAEITDAWARALVDGDAQAQDEARQRLLDWNEKNPEMPIRINRAQIATKAKKMRQSRAERYIKTVAPERRAAAKQEMSS